MSKRSQHLAVRALPELARELRAYKRRAIREFNRRIAALPPGRMRDYLRAQRDRRRAMSPAQYRDWYTSECVRRISDTPRLELVRDLAAWRGNAHRMVRL